GQRTAGVARQYGQKVEPTGDPGVPVADTPATTGKEEAAMKAPKALASTVGGLALILGMTLPAAAQVPPATAAAPEQLAQAQPDAPRPGPRMGERRQGSMHGHGGWHRHKMHRFSLAGLALRHRQELALTPAQVDNL